VNDQLKRRPPEHLDDDPTPLTKTVKVVEDCAWESLSFIVERVAEAGFKLEECRVVKGSCRYTGDTEVNVEGTRLENADEVAVRVAKAKANKAEAEAKERAQYEALKAKFEKKT
jgi:hypothetical protein